MAGNSNRDQANRRQKLGLVWRIRKKISQIIKDYFHLPFFLLIILWEWQKQLFVGHYKRDIENQTDILWFGKSTDDVC
jgi:hypothetical protein